MVSWRWRRIYPENTLPVLQSISNESDEVTHYFTPDSSFLCLRLFYSACRCNLIKFMGNLLFPSQWVIIFIILCCSVLQARIFNVQSIKSMFHDSSNYCDWTAIPEERGSYGFWTICSNVHSINLGISWNCDPINTMFRSPPLMSTAGVLAIIHIVLIVLFFPFCILRLLQVLRDRNDLLMSPATIGIIKVSLAILSAIFAALVLVLTTVREEAAEQTVIYRMTAYKHYTISKSWAFWLEVAVISIEVPLVIFCAIENTQLMKVDALIKLSDIASLQSSIPRTSPYFRSSPLGLQDIHSARPVHVIPHPRANAPSRVSSSSHHHSRPQTSSSQDSSSNCTSCPIHCSHRTMNCQQNHHRHTLRPFSTPSATLATHHKTFADDVDDDRKCASGRCYQTTNSSRIQRESVEVTRRDRNSLSSTSKHVKISQSQSQSPSSSLTPNHSPTNTFLNSVFEDLPILSQHPFQHSNTSQRQRPPTERY